jgi:hypothetical protein
LAIFSDLSEILDSLASPSRLDGGI